MDLYKILHINERSMKLPSESINLIKDRDIGSLSKIIEYTNKFHSYFHFEQSFAYLLCAFLYKQMGKEEMMETYLEKSLFQDHTNPIALEFDDPAILDILSYDRYFMSEDDFLDFALGDHLIDDLAEYIDLETYRLVQYFKGEEEDSFYKVTKAPLQEYNPDGTHRLAILHGLYEFKRNNIASALTYALESVRNLEDSHKAYHMYASELYKERARVFEKVGEKALSKNDLVKANDLYPAFS